MFPKTKGFRSESYRRRVAELPCALCGIIGYSQCAHSDEGKGMAMKSDDRTCYPACGPRLGIQGCHYFIGTSGTLTKAARRDMEKRFAAETRQKLDIGA
jgi:hypothetical protein